MLLATQSHACILALASEPCLCPGEHLKDRVQIGTDKKKAGDFGTWAAQGAEWVTIGRYGASTVVYLPSQDAYYYASPQAMLAPQCPDKTVFLGQFLVEDSAPRVLVHDLVRVQGVSFASMPPRERYACLQQLGAHLGPACTVQWAGECKALAEELRTGRFKVPHAVKGILAFTAAPGRTVEVD